jgi:hypothetical protein
MAACSLFTGLTTFLRNFEIVDIGTCANKSNQISFRIVQGDSATYMSKICSIGMADWNFIGPPSARLDAVPKISWLRGLDDPDGRQKEMAADHAVTSGAVLSSAEIGLSP